MVAWIESFLTQDPATGKVEIGLQDVAGLIEVTPKGARALAARLLELADLAEQHDPASPESLHVLAVMADAAGMTSPCVPAPDWEAGGTHHRDGNLGLSVCPKFRVTHSSRLVPARTPQSTASCWCALSPRGAWHRPRPPVGGGCSIGGRPAWGVEGRTGQTGSLAPRVPNRCPATPLSGPESRSSVKQPRRPR